MTYAVFVIGVLAVIAIARVEKLIRTLKAKGILDQDYKED